MTKRKKKSNKRKWILAGLLALVGAIIAIVYFRGQNAPKGEEVEVDIVQKRTIEEAVSASGRIFPEVEVIISSDVSGEIVALYVEEGDSVYAGQPLLKIDPEAYVSAVQRGQANVNNARAQLAMSRAQIQSGIAGKEELKTQLVQARRVHQRNELLFKEGVVTQILYDESLSQIESLNARLVSSDANIKSSQEGANGAEFAVKSSEATLRELNTELGRTAIKAPNKGIISSLSVEKGERVVGTAQMAGTEIMRISNLNTMEVQVEVSENDILKVSEGDRTEIEVDAYIDKVFDGIVTEIANSATNVAGMSANASLNTDQVTNFIVKIRINNDSYNDLISEGQQYPFRPGMSASVDIITDVKKDILTVPIQAVTVRIDEDDEDAEYEEVVFVYDADTAKMIYVTTGIQDDDFIHIVSGLDDSTQLVSGPYSALSKVLEDGSQLRIKEDDKKGGKKKK